MKTILILLLVSISSICGTITNKSNDDQLILTVDSVTQKLTIEKLNSEGVTSSELDLTTNDSRVSEVSIKLRYEETFASEIFTAPFKATEIIAKDSYKEKQYQVFLFLPLVTALDVAFFPITIPSYFIKKAYVKKDLRVLNEALNTDKSIQVNKRRYKRIMKLLAL